MNRVNLGSFKDVGGKEMTLFEVLKADIYKKRRNIFGNMDCLVAIRGVRNRISAVRVRPNIKHKVDIDGRTMKVVYGNFEEKKIVAPEVQLKHLEG